MADITRDTQASKIIGAIKTYAPSSGPTGGTTVEQSNPNSLNCNANIQIGDVDVSNSNPVPTSKATKFQSNIVTDSNIGASDGVLVSQSTSIDVSTVGTLGLFINYTANDSTGAELQILPQHTSGGTVYPLEADVDYKITIGDSDFIKFYKFDCAGLNFIQIKTQATDVDTGGGTIGTITIDIVKD